MVLSRIFQLSIFLLLVVSFFFLYYRDDCPYIENYSATIEVVPNEVSIGDRLTLTANFVPEKPVVLRLNADPLENFALGSWSHRVRDDEFVWVLSDIADRSPERITISHSEPLTLSLTGVVSAGPDKDVYIIDFGKHGHVEAKRGERVHIGGSIYHGGYCGGVASESQSIDFEYAVIQVR